MAKEEKHSDLSHASIVQSSTTLTPLRTIVQHVFMPPELPQKGEADVEEALLPDLVKRLARSLIGLADTAVQTTEKQWAKALAESVQRLGLEWNPSRLGPIEALTDHIHRLSDAGRIRDTPLAPLLIFVPNHNSGLILSAGTKASLHAEIFELATPNSVTMSTNACIKRQFPERAITVPSRVATDRAFCRELVRFCHSACTRDVLLAITAPRTNKHKSKVIETRDTCDPALFDILLHNILLAYGSTEDKGTWIAKRMRDDVLWSSSLLPWRRAMSWTFLRVSLQLSCERSGLGRHTYKRFLVSFMSDLLDEAWTEGQEPRLLFCMVQKIVQRLLKLKLERTDALFIRCSAIVRKIHKSNTNKWNAVQSMGSSIEKAVMKTEEAIAVRWKVDSLRMPELKDFIDEIAGLSAASPLGHHTEFPTDYIREFKLQEGPPVDGLGRLDGVELVVRLAKLERWVEMSLSGWRAISVNRQTTVHVLYQAIRDYQAASREAYSNRPESMSIMILTLLDMWAALDREVCTMHPLLEDYDPEMSGQLLEPLLLPRHIDMVRARSIEEYVSGRHRRAHVHGGSAVFDCDSSRSFPLRFFQSSQELQDLKKRIESCAQAERNEVLEQLRELKRDYEELLRESDKIEQCNYESGLNQRGRWVTTHERCDKCDLIAQAKGLRITTHEWPLPSTQSKAEAVVFALNSPSAFKIWRDATYLLCTVLYDHGSPIKAETGFTRVEEVDILRRYASSARPRLQLATRHHHFTNSHYREQSVGSADESTVAVHHGATYDLFDDDTGSLVHVLSPGSRVRDLCTPQLGKGLSCIQRYLYDTSHTSNEVLCHKQAAQGIMTEREYVTFGHFRAGARLQWPNILRQLVDSTLDLRKNEVELLIIQIIWQLQAQVDDVHHEAGLANFRFDVIDALNDIISSFEDNWQAASAIRTSYCIALRLLSLRSDLDDKTALISILARCRSCIDRWISELQRQLRSAIASEESVRLRIFELAMDQCCTFDVELDVMSEIFACCHQAALYFRGLIFARDYRPPGIPDMDSALVRLFHRFCRLVVRGQTTVEENILNVGRGLGLAIDSVWGCGNHKGLWKRCDSGGGGWLTSLLDVSKGNGREHDHLHFDVLTGELRCNGQHLSRLPVSYEEHPTYIRLFGRRVIEVTTTEEPGFEYRSREPLQSQILFFSRKGSILNVLARSKARELYLVPTDILQQLPRVLVKSYVHFYQPADSTVYFHPLHQILGDVEGRAWTINRLGDRFSVRSIEGNVLLDPESALYSAIVKSFQPLDTPRNMTISEREDIVSVNLSRLNLHFRADRYKKGIFSLDWPGMQVDPNQSCGTMTGLKNKLLLYGEGPSKRVPRRIMIVVDGPFRVLRTHEHVQISLRWAEVVNADVMRWYSFEIDATLGRLIGDDTVDAQLLQSKLHLLTSSTYPDKLTGFSGAQQALRILRGQGLRSFMMLSVDDAARLRDMKLLLPHRSFYPPGKSLMQMVDRRAHCPVAQYGGVLQELKNLQSLALKLRPFQSWQVDPDLPDWGEESLHKRDSLRSTHLRVDGFKDDDKLIDLKYTRRLEPELISRDICARFRQMNLDQGPTLSERLDIFTTSKRWGKPIRSCQHDADTATAVAERIISVICEGGDLKDLLCGHWCQLCNWAVDAGQRGQKHELLFRLATLAFVGLPLQLVIVLKAISNDFHELIEARPEEGFDLSLGLTLSRKHIISLSEKSRVSFRESEEYIPVSVAEPGRQLSRYNEFMTAGDDMLEQLIDHIVKHDIKRTFALPSHISRVSKYFDCSKLVSDIDRLCRSLQANNRYAKWCRDIQNTLDKLPIEPLKAQEDARNYHQSTAKEENIKKTVKLADRLHACIPPNIPALPARHYGVTACMSDTRRHEGSKTCHNAEIDVVQKVLDLFEDRSQGALSDKIKDDLVKSRDALAAGHGINEISLEWPETVWENEVSLWLDRVRLIHDHIIQALSAKECEPEIELAQEVGSAPPLPLDRILELSSSKGGRGLPPGWKSTFQQCAHALACLRCLLKVRRDTHAKAIVPNELLSLLESDLAQPRCDDWLVLQVEQGIAIRDEQYSTADCMMKKDVPNAVYQLQMGKGKSSVIMPMLIAAQATSPCLVRTMTLGTLIPETFRTLKSRLTHAMDRPVMYMPVMRSTSTVPSLAQKLKELFKYCIEAGGALLVEPEHVQSLELLAWERQLQDGREENSDRPRDELMSLQRWLHSICVDIFDESDEILRVNHELIYTLGQQQHIDFSPWRWRILFEIVTVTLSSAQELARVYPTEIEVWPAVVSDGRLPVVRILDSKGETRLLLDVTRKITEMSFGGVALWTKDGSPELASVVHSYLTGIPWEERQPDYENLLNGMSEDERRTIMLLRAILGRGILSFCLHHRWRVTFGLDRKRNQLAVPFRGKDQPAVRTDFSHPDVAIVLTAMSYLYSGLTDEELVDIVARLQASTTGDAEYSTWVEISDSVPTSMSNLRGINLLDTGTCKRALFPALRFNRHAVRSFLLTLVFPACIREFPQRIAASGWSLARRQDHRTTGFSGTNGSRWILPYSMEQSMLPGQDGTNALLVKTVMQCNDNLIKACEQSQMLDRAGVQGFLEVLPSDIRVLIDVGAQLLGCDNETTVRTWLACRDDVTAAIFFDENDSLRVLHRSGQIQILRTSPFRHRLGECLVFLDEPHARGTDLVLPHKYQALVTLGPGLTLDRLLQACARMRRLGPGQQRLHLFMPDEVGRDIALRFGFDTTLAIQTEHVLAWSQNNDTRRMHTLFPLWESQGNCQTRRLYAEHLLESESTFSVSSLSDLVIEPEAQTLFVRYEERAEERSRAIARSCADRELFQGMRMVPPEVRRCQDFLQSQKRVFGTERQHDMLLTEQQERQLAPETQEEVEIQLPPPPRPNPHRFCEILSQFALHGEMTHDDALSSCMKMLRNTNLSGYGVVRELEGGNVMVTDDFIQVFAGSEATVRSHALFLRPMEWVLCSQRSDVKVIVSPFEANVLMSLLRQETADGSLRLCLPRVTDRPGTRSLLTLSATVLRNTNPVSDLDHCRLLALAGTNFFRDREEYRLFCRVFGLCYKRVPGVSVAADGFIRKADRPGFDQVMAQVCVLSQSPIPFLREIWQLRRSVEASDHSHMRFLLDADLSVQIGPVAERERETKLASEDHGSR